LHQFLCLKQFFLVFNADFNTHTACTMAVDNLFRYFVIISVRKENILKIEYGIFHKMIIWRNQNLLLAR